MKPASILCCLAPTIALAAEPIPPEAPTPALAHPTPSTSLLHNLDPSDRNADEPLEGHQVLHLADDNAPLALVEDPASTTVPDPWPAPATGHIGLGTLTPSPGATKSLRARSEGTLGQTPWVGMAIGLTFTALAAVMLG